MPKERMSATIDRELFMEIQSHSHKRAAEAANTNKDPPARSDIHEEIVRKG